MKKGKKGYMKGHMARYDVNNWIDDDLKKASQSLKKGRK